MRGVKTSQCNNSDVLTFYIHLAIVGKSSLNIFVVSININSVNVFHLTRIIKDKMKMQIVFLEMIAITYKVT